MKKRNFCWARSYAALVAGVFAAYSVNAIAAVANHSSQHAAGIIFETNQYIVELSPTDRNDGTVVKYRPNTLASSGFQFTLYDLTAAYKTSSGRNASDDAKKGVTNYEDLRFNLTFGGRDQWMAGAYYTRYAGLYIENSSDVDPTYSGLDTFIQRGDISIFNYGASLMYVWNPEKFSLAAAIFQSARQTESGGSLLVMGAFDGSQFYASSSIIPSTKQNLFGQDADLTAGRFNTASAAAGYGYTLTTGTHFLSALALIGPGYQWRQYTASGAQASSSANASKFYVAASAGYNGETLYAALNYSDIQTENATQSVRIRPHFQQIKAILGVRF